MNEWLKRQLADGLPAFTGSSVSGTLVLKQEIVNELLADLLRAGGVGAVRGPTDIGALVPLLKAVSVRAETGVLMIDFQIVV